MTDKQLDKRFAPLIETLLAGSVICPYRFERLHDLLRDPESSERAEAERIMSLMDRELVVQGELFFAVYKRETAAATEAISERISHYLQDEELVHGFFDLIRQTIYEGQAPDVGDRFSLSEVLSRIETSQQHTERIQKLDARARSNTRPTAPSIVDALKKVIERLENNGYLHCLSQKRDEYVVTGELELFNMWWEFALEQEGYDTTAADEATDEPAPEQEDML